MYIRLKVPTCFHQIIILCKSIFTNYIIGQTPKCQRYNNWSTFIPEISKAVDKFIDSALDDGLQIGNTSFRKEFAEWCAAESV